MTLHRHVHAPLRGIAALVLLLSLGGCGSRGLNPFSGSAASARTELRVENRNWADMTIYLHRGSSRQRLGLVSTNQTRSFALPEHLVASGASVAFEADPVGSDESYRSPSLTLTGGERVTWTLMANLAQSTLTHR